MIPKTITAAEFDALFDSGSDEIDQYVNWATPVRPQAEREIDMELGLGAELVERIDAVASRTSIPRMELIRRWLTEKLDEAA